MERIIVYGSRYGSSRRYAEELSGQTGIPAVSYKKAPALSDAETIVYLGGLYDGGVPGLEKTLKGLSLRPGQKLIIVTVGLADPEERENRKNIRASLQKRLPDELFSRARIFHLRGAIDYEGLNAGHRAMMSLLYRSLCRTPPEKLTAEDRALMETYGKQVDFTDFGSLEPVIAEIRRGTA